MKMYFFSPFLLILVHSLLVSCSRTAFVDASLSAGRAAALFSATLTPPGYYRTVLGCPEARAVALAVSYTHLDVYKRQALA